MILLIVLECTMIEKLNELNERVYIKKCCVF